MKTIKCCYWFGRTAKNKETHTSMLQLVVLLCRYRVASDGVVAARTRQYADMLIKLMYC